jgi:acetoin utilization protein AcuB
MYVELHMKKDPVTVDPQTTVEQARTMLQKHNFRHLPVVDDSGVLLGMVTDRDIRSAYPSSVLDQVEKDRVLEKLNITPVTDIMSTGVVSLSKFSTLDDALLMLDRERVGALPVLDEKRCVVGIFSIRDLLKAYNELFGVGEKGSALVAVKADGKPHPLTRIITVLESAGISFSRVVRKNETDAEKGHETIFIRVNTFNIHTVHNLLEKAGFTP